MIMKKIILSTRKPSRVLRRSHRFARSRSREEAAWKYVSSNQPQWKIAQRIIDFTSGSCFAISGNLQKISNYIFIITPASVDISGDFLSLVDTFQSTRSVQTDF